MSRQIYAVPDLCCIVSRRLVELVGGVFDSLLSSARAVFEQEGCVDWLLTATMYTKLTTGYGHAASLIWMQQSLGVTVMKFRTGALYTQKLAHLQQSHYFILPVVSSARQPNSYAFWLSACFNSKW